MADGTGAVDAGTGGAGGAGADAGGASPGAAPGAAGAGAGAGVAAVTGASGAAAAGDTGAAAWYGGLDADSTGWLQNKGWFGTDFAKADLAKAFPAMVKSYRNNETVLGRNRLPMPKDAADTEAWNHVYAALGRPADWKAYGLKAGEGGNQAYMDGFAEMAFAEGLSTKQATSLAQKWDAKAQEWQATARAEAEQAFISQSQNDLGALKREWGANADAQFAAAQRAGVAFGIDKADMNAIERAVGTRKFLSMMASIGASISEDGGAGAGDAGAMRGGMTPEGARARLNELGKDTEWQKRYRAGGAEEKAEFRRLTGIIAGAAA